MPKLQRFEIVLANPQVVYWPGQFVEGQLYVDLSDDMKMRGIRIECRGKCSVHWAGGGDDSYSDSEEYMRDSLVLYGNAPDETVDTVILKAGQHIFPFRFLLPTHLPGSFEGCRNCHLRYWLKGIIHKPWKSDSEVKRPFTVGSMLDLNLQPNAVVAVQDVGSKTVCCCCCESGPTTAVLRIDRAGYVPGESIICNIEIIDASGQNTVASIVRLKMKTTYRTHGGSSTFETTELARIQHEAMQPRASDRWSERIPVPCLPPSFLPGCSLINIEYYVKVNIILDSSSDLSLKCHVIIGSIPLRSVVQQCLPNYQPQPVTDQPAAQGGPFHTDIPPPSYQECVLKKGEIIDDEDNHVTANKRHAPAYSYYEWLENNT